MVTRNQWIQIAISNILNSCFSSNKYRIRYHDFPLNDGSKKCNIIHKGKRTIKDDVVGVGNDVAKNNNYLY